MTNAELILTLANIFQTVALAWIVAWQQRAAQLVRQLNGDVVAAIEAQSTRVEA